MRQTPNTTIWISVMLVISGMWVILPPSEMFANPTEGPQGRSQSRLARPAQPGATTQGTVALPKFPQKYEVQGPESDSFGFAVTQPGPIAVDVQAQGAPVVVTLQSAGGQPITQRGTGLLRLFYNATPQDVQRSLFWQVQIKAWCEDDCLTAGKRPNSTGSVTVQHPPVDQAAVQKAVQALTAHQTQPQQPDPAQAAALAAQADQAFQQRQGQFEHLQQQRRAALYSQIQPQVDQLRARMGLSAGIRTRGLEGSPEAEQATDAGEVGTRALPQMRGQGAPAAQMPTFPQQFAVQGPESDSFAFAVTQPGPIHVEVQSQGPPVIVTLQHLASAPKFQQGSGQIRLSYDVTSGDIQKSVLWVVKVRLAQAGSPASGTVMVQHPAANQAVVQAQTTALAEQERANRARTEAEAEAQSRAEFQAFKAHFEQQYQQRLSAERAQNQSLLKRLRPQSGGMIRSRGLNPSITRVNKNEGQPKTQVIIEGTNFGPGGEVVFQLGPNVTGTGIVEAWADTVVVANVPDASGLLPYQGTVAIKAGQTISNSMPFKFIPVEEVREIRTTRGDISIAQPGTVTAGSVSDRIEHENTSFMQLSGSKGNDIFFPTRPLINGWVVQNIKPKVDPCSYPDCRGAYVADHRIGTSSPFFNMRWWHEALVGSRYWFSLWIVGPRGVPDGIAVTGPLAPVVPPGTPPPATTASNTPADRTPPAQPPYTPPPSSSNEPVQMTMVPINPALLIPPVQAAPGSGTSTPSQPPASQSGSKKLAVEPALNNPGLQQPPPATGGSMPPQGASSSGTGSSTPPSSPPGPTTPVITSLSVGQGQPGDPVMITGNNFGGGPGEIHFVIANGKDVKAPAGAIWSDSQIFTSVPDATGLLAYSGQVYVKRTGDQKTSNLVAFRFEPTLELRQFRPTWPVRDMAPLQRTPSDTTCHASNGDAANASVCVSYRPPSAFEGAKGTDQYFLNTRLKNGWVLDDVAFQSIRCIGGCNYLDEKAIGTDRLYFTVRWWVNAEGFGFNYSRFNILWLAIRGPKGVSDGVVMP